MIHRQETEKVKVHSVEAGVLVQVRGDTSRTEYSRIPRRQLPRFRPQAGTRKVRAESPVM